MAYAHPVLRPPRLAGAVTGVRQRRKERDAAAAITTSVWVEGKQQFEYRAQAANVFSN